MTGSGLLVIISGPSATGKGTIRKELLECRPDMFFSVSATTRAARDGETDGVHYHFIDKKTFEDMIEADDFLEWAKVYDHYYGTPRRPVTEALAAGKDVLLEIDVQGALRVKKQNSHGIFIFIVPPSLEVLRKRIICRGTDSLEEINKRMGKATGELAFMPEYNYVVVNDQLDIATSKVESIIVAETCRSERFKLVKDPVFDRSVVENKY